MQVFRLMPVTYPLIDWLTAVSGFFSTVFVNPHFVNVLRLYARGTLLLLRLNGDRQVHSIQKCENLLLKFKPWSTTFSKAAYALFAMDGAPCALAYRRTGNKPA